MQVIVAVSLTSLIGMTVKSSPGWRVRAARRALWTPYG